MVEKTCISCFQLKKHYSKGYYSSCYYKNEEVKKIKKDYRDKNRDKLNEKSRIFKKNNPEKIKFQNKRWAEKNKDKIKEKNKKWAIKNRNILKIKNKKWKKEKDYYKKRRKNNLSYKLITNLRSRNSKIFRGKIKNLSTKESLECTPEFLQQHLIRQFNSKMTVENYGKYWHIDHIIPISSGKTVEEIHKLNHYTNLQPLEKIENIRKGAKINHDYVTFKTGNVFHFPPLRTGVLFCSI